MKNSYSRLALVLGLSVSLLLYSFVNPELMKLYQARLMMAFTAVETDLDVYVFTYWNSPESAKLDPLFKSMAPESQKKLRLTFLDIPTDDTQAFQRANLALTLNPKKQLAEYFKARSVLFELASKNPKATDEEIKQATTRSRIKYEPSKKELLDLSLKVSAGTIQNLKVTTTPTVIIFNTKLPLKKKTRGVRCHHFSCNPYFNSAPWSLRYL